MKTTDEYVWYEISADRLLVFNYATSYMMAIFCDIESDVIFIGLY
jgi:hypothetical protein